MIEPRARDSATVALRDLIPAWGTVFYDTEVIRDRTLSVNLFIQYDGEYRDITGAAATALGLPIESDGSFVWYNASRYTSGAEAIAALSQRLYPGRFTPLQSRSMASAPKRW